MITDFARHLAHRLGQWPFAHRAKSRTRRRSTRRPFAAATMERLEPRLLMAAGDLDTSFGGDGRVEVAFDFGGGLVDNAQAVAVDRWGRTIVAGTVETGGGYYWAVARLRRNGRLDRSFSLDGKAVFRFGAHSHVAGVTVDRWGRVIVVGSTLNAATGNWDVAVARLKVNGRLDGRFSRDGRATVRFDMGGFHSDQGVDVALDRWGRIVVAATVSRKEFGDSDFGIARLTGRGTLDRRFGNDGKVVVAFDRGGTGSDSVAGIAIDRANRIVVAGSVQTGTAGFDFGVTRLLVRGQLDPSFGTAGKLVVGFDLGGTDDDLAFDVAVDRYNRIVVAGGVTLGVNNFDFGVVRLDAGGGLDSNFDVDGRKTVGFNLGGDHTDYAAGVAIDRQGRIVLAGTVDRSTLGDRDFGVVRLTSGGQPDFTFSDDGKAVVAFDRGGLKRDDASGVAVDLKGRIVIVGLVEAAIGGDFGIARLLG